jgi:hypothetical protein
MLLLSHGITGVGFGEMNVGDLQNLHGLFQAQIQYGMNYFFHII